MIHALLLSILIAACAVEPQADNETASILKELDGKVAEVKDVSATFTERKYTALLKKPLLSTGTVRAKGTRALWETRRPHRSVVSLGQERIQIYYPKRNALETYELSKDGGDRAWLNCLPIPRLDRLEAGFAIEHVSVEAIAPTGYEQEQHLGLRLVPKDESLSGYIERVSVVVDRETGCVVLAEMVNPDGDRTVIEFTKIKINGGLKDADLDLAVPADVSETRPLGGKSE